MQQKPKIKNWVAETEDLSAQVAIEEALAAVQKLWEKTLSEMKDEDRTILSDYLEGTTIKELARKYQLSYKNTKTLITKLKRDCIRNLTNKTAVRN